MHRFFLRHQKKKHAEKNNEYLTSERAWLLSTKPHKWSKPEAPLELRYWYCFLQNIFGNNFFLIGKSYLKRKENEIDYELLNRCK